MKYLKLYEKFDFDDFDFEEEDPNQSDKIYLLSLWIDTDYVTGQCEINVVELNRKLDGGVYKGKMFYKDNSTNSLYLHKDIDKIIDKPLEFCKIESVEILLFLGNEYPSNDNIKNISGTIEDNMTKLFHCYGIQDDYLLDMNDFKSPTKGKWELSNESIDWEDEEFDEEEFSNSYLNELDLIIGDAKFDRVLLCVIPEKWEEVEDELYNRYGISNFSRIPVNSESNKYYYINIINSYDEYSMTYWSMTDEEEVFKEYTTNIIKID